MAHTISAFIAGDMLLSRPWLEPHHPEFEALVHHLRLADVCVANLETTIHEFDGYAQPDSGGAYTSAPPAVASELASAGIGIVSTANNHSFDYGSEGVLSTLRHLDNAGIAHAGTGHDLQEASAPCYWTVSSGQRVALVAMTSTFHHYNAASLSRDDLHGRPGVNPLALVKGPVVGLPDYLFERMVMKRKSRMSANSRLLRWQGLKWERSPQFSVSIRRRPLRADLSRNLEAIASARSEADLVIVSIHSHNEERWLRSCCQLFVEQGAHCVFVHGSHRVGAIEVYKGRPIFYGLGDFVFQPHLIDRMPSDAYHRLGLEVDSSVGDFYKRRVDKGLSDGRSAFQGAAAIVRWGGDDLEEIRLIGVDLQFDADNAFRGSPRLAHVDLSRVILGQIARASRRYGTSIHFDAQRNFASVGINTSANPATRE